MRRNERLRYYWITEFSYTATSFKATLPISELHSLNHGGINSGIDNIAHETGLETDLVRLLAYVQQLAGNVCYRDLPVS